MELSVLSKKGKINEVPYSNLSFETVTVTVLLRSILAATKRTQTPFFFPGKQVTVVKKTKPLPAPNHDPVSTVSGSMVPLTGSRGNSEERKEPDGNGGGGGGGLTRQRSLTEAMEHFFRKMSFRVSLGLFSWLNFAYIFTLPLKQPSRQKQSLSISLKSQYRMPHQLELAIILYT